MISERVPTQRGLFVTFEGGEGSGKTTQSELLTKYLEAQGRRVLRLREPGGTPLGEELRRILLASGSLAPKAELLLFLAARAELVEKVIKPALAGGVWVICDRFIDSTAAYQGYGRGIDLQLIRTLNEAVIDGCLPDLTVLLDIDPDGGLSRARAGAGGDAIEGHWQAGLLTQPSGGAGGRRVGGRDKAFHRRVRKGYLALAKAEPGRWLVLDATLPPHELAQAVATRAQALLVK
jgi:dTMP kinase